MKPMNFATVDFFSKVNSTREWTKLCAWIAIKLSAHTWDRNAAAFHHYHQLTCQLLKRLATDFLFLDLALSFLAVIIYVKEESCIIFALSVYRTGCVDMQLSLPKYNSSNNVFTMHWYVEIDVLLTFCNNKCPPSAGNFIVLIGQGEKTD